MVRSRVVGAVLAVLAGVGGSSLASPGVRDAVRGLVAEPRGPAVDHPSGHGARSPGEPGAVARAREADEDETPAPAPSPTPEPPAAVVRSVPAGEAGTVTLAVRGGRLELLGVDPAPGWTFEVERGAGEEVEVRFASGPRHLEFKAEVEDGRLRVRVEAEEEEDEQGPSPSPSAGPAGSPSPSPADEDGEHERSGGGHGERGERD